MKYDVVIGIDPDVDRNGVGFLEVKTRKLEATALPFPDLLDYLADVRKKSQESGRTVVVVVEASWRDTTNWHTTRWESRAKSTSKGYDVGRNHETGHKIVEMCRHYGLDVIEHHPLRKGWRGRDGKITQDELSYFTGITGRTNQEMRDAALLAWSFADLPIRIKVGK